MTDQDGIDNSRWNTFFNDEAQYWSNAQLEQAIADLIAEREIRPRATQVCSNSNKMIEAITAIDLGMAEFVRPLRNW